MELKLRAVRERADKIHGDGLPTVVSGLEEAARVLRVDPVNLCSSDTSPGLPRIAGCPQRCAAKTRKTTMVVESLLKTRLSSCGRVVGVVQEGKADGQGWWIHAE